MPRRTSINFSVTTKGARKGQTPTVARPAVRSTPACSRWPARCRRPQGASAGEVAYRLNGFGFGSRCRLRAVGRGGRSRAALLAAPAPARAPRRLRLGKVLGEGPGHVVDGPQLFAGGVEQLRRTRRVALRRGQQRRGHRSGCSRAAATSFAAFSSWRGPVSWRRPRRRFASANSALAARSCALRVARASRHVQRRGSGPVRRVCHAQSPEAASPARQPVLLPGRRLRDERDEVVEARAVDLVETRSAAPSCAAAGWVLGRAGEEELVERLLPRAPVREAS